MLASELIERLQGQIYEHGDLQVIAIYEAVDGRTWEEEFYFDTMKTSVTKYITMEV